MTFAFAGTPQFAAWVLRELVELGRVPALVVSQPDRPRGRGRAGSAPETVVEAGRLGLVCLQTADINSVELLDSLKRAGVGTLVVAAFGQLLKRPLLDALECINLHASLLPKYRGAAPIERALMAGETATGVSIMRITEELDAGPWAQQSEVSVSARQDAGSLARLLAVAGAGAVAEVLDSIADGTVRWTEQAGTSTYAEKLRPAECWLDLQSEARRVHDQVRALSPRLGARVRLGDTEVKIWRTWPFGGTDIDAPAPLRGRRLACGSIWAGEGHLYLGCAEGILELLELQPVCKARMSAAEFLRGYGKKLGETVSPPRSEEGRACGDS